MRFLLSIALILSLAVNAYTAWIVHEVNEVSYPGVRLFHADPDDGRLVVQGKYGSSNGQNGSTALDIWPPDATLPDFHAITEIVLYRTRSMDWPNFERINWTALASPNNPQFRFGVERGGNGEFRPMWFCFEDITPGVPECKLRIELDGVYVKSGINWVKIGD